MWSSEGLNTIYREPQVYAYFGDQFCTAQLCGRVIVSGYVNTSALKFHDCLYLIL
jgi:hypothetical protein